MFQKVYNVKKYLQYIYHFCHCFPRAASFVAGNLDVLVAISLKGTRSDSAAHWTTIELINKSNVFTSTLSLPPHSS